MKLVIEHSPALHANCVARSSVHISPDFFRTTIEAGADLPRHDNTAITQAIVAQKSHQGKGASRASSSCACHCLTKLKPHCVLEQPQAISNSHQRLENFFGDPRNPSSHTGLLCLVLLQLSLRGPRSKRWKAFGKGAFNGRWWIALPSLTTSCLG